MPLTTVSGTQTDHEEMSMRRLLDNCYAAGNPGLASEACLPSDLGSDRLGKEPPPR